jgi:hypothetical protein
MKNKFLYINLIELYLNNQIELDIFIKDYQTLVLKEKSTSVYKHCLNRLSGSLCLYTKGIEDKSSINKWIEGTLTKLNMSTLDLQTQVKQEEIAIAIKYYQEGLPLNLLKLMSEAEKEGIRYSVRQHNEKEPEVYYVHFEDLHHNENEGIYTNSKFFYELEDIKKLINNARKLRLETESKANILKSAQEKLEQTFTEEELNLLKENELI